MYTISTKFLQEVKSAVTRIPVTQAVILITYSDEWDVLTYNLAHKGTEKIHRKEAVLIWLYFV